MDPNDQNQQQMGDMMQSDQTQNTGFGDQQASPQQMSEPQTQGVQGMPDQPVAGPEPMPEFPGQETTGGVMGVTPPPSTDASPVEQVGMAVPEQVNPVEPSSQYGADQQSVGGQVAEEVQSGGDSNPPQGI